tara:strand:- start:776 stop:1324 length:549 start_codon:yes stop_codon:yes gene_type:complete
MDRDLSIAITGTPGTGKTSLSKIFSSKQIKVISVKELAEELGFLGELDASDGSREIDIHRLSDEWEHNDSGMVVVEGHLSHFLDVDAIIILRCNPKILQNRLEKRGYSEQKVRANTEWELVSGIWSELLEFEIEAPILEIDTTNKNSEEVYEEAIVWLQQEPIQEGLIENAERAIDWFESKI